MSRLPQGFDAQPSLSGDGLTLSPLRPEDREALFAAASDPAIWAQHPARDRHARVAFDPYFDFLLSAGGTLALRAHGPDGVIGCSRFYGAPDIAPSIAIGFTFLKREHWGGRTNAAMKRLMLTHAYGSTDTVWLHIAPGNLRSQTATDRLGAVHAYDARLDLGQGARETQVWRLTRAAWEAARG